MSDLLETENKVENSSETTKNTNKKTIIGTNTTCQKYLLSPAEVRI